MLFRNLALGGLLLASGPACAQTAAPLTWPVGSAELRLQGEASGAVFGPHQPGWRGTQASGTVLLSPQLKRDYDSGLSLSLNGTFGFEDPLSRGGYDGDVTERLTGMARTGLGTLEIGITDGAGDALDVGGPKVDEDISLDDPRTTFWRDPTDGKAVINLFALRTQAGASSNSAKFVYTSPNLFGVQLALSFAPSEGKQLPFLNAGPHVPGRQADFWEAALRAEQDVGPVSVKAYAAAVTSRGEHKLPGQEGTSDYSFGAHAEYPLSEDITVSWGGSWRQSNAYTFDVNQSWQPSTTRGQHVSAAIIWDKWIAGVEYSNGVAREVRIANLPRIGLNGTQASIGYTLSDSVRASAGWQHQSYGRSSGVFFDGTQQLKLDALFLHLNVHTAELSD